MGTSKIEWLDGGKTWNPITGCTKVSPGCANCYAERMSKRLAGRCGYPADDPFRVTLHPERLDEPRHWKKPCRIFPVSMGDWMHPDVPAGYTDSMLEVMAACSQHLFLTLTKRPELLEQKLYGVTPECGCRELGGGDYLPNVMLGVTVEDQKRADERMPHLMKLAAMGWRTWVSLEPLLGDVDGLRPWIHHIHGPNWLVCGGETGPGARPAPPDWFRQIRDAAASSGAPFYFKSWGEWRPVIKSWGEWQSVGKYIYGAEVGGQKNLCVVSPDGTIRFPWDNLLAVGNPPAGSWTMRRVGQKAAGRMLDGRTHDEVLEGKDNHA